MDLIVNILNNIFMYYFYWLGSFVLIVFSILMFVGIKRNGKVILIDSIFKKKNFDRPELTKRYTIQAIYTFLIGVALFVYLLVFEFDGVALFLTLVVFGVLDFIYDYLAIKKATM